jgi:hypothetical protein
MSAISIVTGISIVTAAISGGCWARAASIPTIQRMTSKGELLPPDPVNTRKQIVWNRNAAWFAAAAGFSQAVVALISSWPLFN